LEKYAFCGKNGLEKLHGRPDGRKKKKACKENQPTSGSVIMTLFLGRRELFNPERFPNFFPGLSPFYAGGSIWAKAYRWGVS
jgi:hypothetical protein